MRSSRLSFWLLVVTAMLSACSTSDSSPGCQATEPEREVYGIGGLAGAVVLNDQPVPGQEVELERLVFIGTWPCFYCMPHTAERHSTVTDAAGNFAFADLATGPGEWRLSIPFRRELWGETRVRITDGMVTQQDLVLHEP